MHCSFRISIVRLGIVQEEGQLLGAPMFPAEQSSEVVAADGCVAGRVASLMSSL